MQTEALIQEWFSSGYHCSQVMMMLNLALRQEDNEQLVCALGGLGGGIACGKDCGVVTGGACVLATYAPQLGGTPKGNDNSYKPMVAEFVHWFESTFGSTKCANLVAPQREARLAFCPGIMQQSFNKILALLAARGITHSHE